MGLLKERKVAHYLKMTLNKLNIFGVQETIEYCHEKELQLNFSNTVEIGAAKQINIALSPKEYFETFLKLYCKKYLEGKKLTLPDFAIEEYLKWEKVKSRCSAGRRMAVLTFDDLFLPYPFMAGIGLKSSDGILQYSDRVFLESENDRLFNVLRKHNVEGFNCPLRELDKGKDEYSLESFKEYCSIKNENL